MLNKIPSLCDEGTLLRHSLRSFHFFRESVLHHNSFMLQNGVSNNSLMALIRLLTLNVKELSWRIEWKLYYICITQEASNHSKKNPGINYANLILNPVRTLINNWWYHLVLTLTMFRFEIQPIDSSFCTYWHASPICGASDGRPAFHFSVILYHRNVHSCLC